jgi:hypothetical protein
MPGAGRPDVVVTLNHHHPVGVTRQRLGAQRPRNARPDDDRPPHAPASLLGPSTLCRTRPPLHPLLARCIASGVG